MNQNESRTLLISIGSALFAVFLLYSYTQEKSAELTKKFGAKQRVVVAKEDINEMETIDETKLQVIEKPVDFTEPNAITDPENAVGLVALAPIKKGEQVLQSKIMKPGPVTGLALQVAPSKRALTIPIDETRGVAKLINPGDRIDLIASLDVGKGLNQTKQIKTILQDVTVLATGIRIMNELPVLYEKIGKEEFYKSLRGDTSFNSITIEVSPEEAQDLIFIMSTSPGSLFMTLRHPSDRNKRRMAEASIDSLLGRVPADMIQQQVRMPATPPPAPAPKVVPKKKGPFIDL